jgi:putative phosphoesterase
VKLGLISDTHGRLDAAREAIDRLEQLGADYILHAGDVGDFGVDGTSVLHLLPSGRAAFVFGNNDFDRANLTEHAKALNLQCLDDVGEVRFEGLRIGLTHGDRKARIDALVRSKVDYLITGHTHTSHDLTLPDTRWINPGALHRARPKRFALLDLPSGQLQSFALQGM